MVVFEIGIVLNGLFEVLWIVINKNGILLNLVSVDFEEVDFRIFLDDFVEIFGADFSRSLLFHLDLIHISTNLINKSTQLISLAHLLFNFIALFCTTQ